MKVSVIIPTFNGKNRIKNTLNSLLTQDVNENFEVIVVDDGSTDGTSLMIKKYYPNIKVFTQPNQGPATARNLGAHKAKGDIIVFTDDDCIPLKNWLKEMIRFFKENKEVVGVKGAYKTKQKRLVARFVQLEYEDKYDFMVKKKYIDFIDTYSAAFKRKVFLEFNGYDTSFPVACAEDIELSYRISKKGYKMAFNPNAIVLHTHPDHLLWYMKKKYKFAYWRMLAIYKNPEKILKDSHTPQVMKFQLLLAPVIIISFLGSLFYKFFQYMFLFSVFFFIICSASFIVKSFKKDKVVGFLSPFFLFIRALAQFLGVTNGLFYVFKNNILKGIRK